VGSVAEPSDIADFTGGELALADTVILLMKVMSMHGIIDDAAIVTVFADLENRYRAQNLHSAAAMADYLRTHATERDQETRVQILGPRARPVNRTEPAAQHARQTQDLDAAPRRSLYARRNESDRDHIDPSPPPLQGGIGRSHLIVSQCRRRQLRGIPLENPR
jgi:hypothetical protein